MSQGHLIIGASGHAKVIADILIEQGLDLLGFVDDNELLHGQDILGYPVLGSIQQWKLFKPAGIIIGIGDNLIRKIIYNKLAPDSPPWITAIHPQATLSKSVMVGHGTVIMAGSVINVDTTIRQHCIINTGATIDHDCHIGSFVHIGPGTSIAGGVSVDDETFLGIGSRVIPSCHIGKQSIIGAGAVVTQDIPNNVTAVGVPARWYKKE